MDREQLLRDLELAKQLGDEAVVRAIEARLATVSNPAVSEQAPRLKHENRGWVQRGREGAAAVVTAPSAGMAGLIDLGAMGLRALGAPIPEFDLHKKVSNLRTMLAGQEPDATARLVNAAAEGALGLPFLSKLAFLPTVAGAVGSATTEAALQRGVDPLAAIATGMATGAAPSLIAGSQAGLRNMMATNRLERALAESHPDALKAVIANRQLASKYGLNLTPSQAAAAEGLPAEGLKKLDIELLGSYAENAQRFRESVFAQPAAVQNLKDQLASLYGQPSDKLPATAAALREAAKARSALDWQRVNKAAEAAYGAARTAKPVPEETLLAIKADLASEAAKHPGNKELVSGIKDLLGRIRSVEKLTKGQVLTDDLMEVFQSFKDSLSAPSKGAPTYSDHTAKRLRQLAESALRGRAEQIEPLYATARKQVAALKERIVDKEPFDQLQALVTKGSEPGTYLRSAVGRGEGLMRIGAVPELQPAVKQAIATAINEMDPDELVRALARRPSSERGARTLLVAAKHGEKGLERAFQEQKDILKLIRAVQENPYKITQHPRSEIPQIAVFRSMSPQQIQRTSGITRVLSGLYNRMSDQAILDAINDPTGQKIIEALMRRELALGRALATGLLTPPVVAGD